jgi:hypothetical protein
MIELKNIAGQIVNDGVLNEAELMNRLRSLSNGNGL